jgi:ZIP family zinc transporter
MEHAVMHAGLVLFIALCTFGATIAGGVLALTLRDRLHLILGFSAGAVLAVAFFDLLPEALKLHGEDPSGLLGVAALGFFAYTVIDRLIALGAHPDRAKPGTRIASRGWLGAASLSAHSFMDGFAIGTGFQASASVGAVVAVAVIAHDCSDGMNTVNMVVKNGGSRRDAFGWLALDAIAPIAGAAASLFVRFTASELALVLALFAGFFIYIGASDLLPESFHAHPKTLTTIMTLLGAAFLYAVVRLAG